MADIPIRMTTVVLDGRAREVRICNEPGCTGVHVAKGQCQRHYRTAQSRRRAALIKALNAQISG